MTHILKVIDKPSYEDEGPIANPSGEVLKCCTPTSVVKKYDIKYIF